MLYRKRVGASIILAATLGGLTIVRTADGAAFAFRDFGAGPDGDGIGILSPAVGGSAAPVNSFYRWQQETITYSFTPAFTSAYGAGGEAAVSAAFATWNSAVSIALNPGTDISSPMQPGDRKILAFTENIDLESVALHEIGHVLGSDHPDVADLTNNNTTGNFNNPPVNKNYTISGGAWTIGALGAGNHPVMWSLMEDELRRRELTDDDLYWSQFLYDDDPASAVGGAGIGGPIFGGGVEFMFSEVPTGGNVIIDAAFLGGSTLASTGVTTEELDPVVAWRRAVSATIIFSVPEPSSLSLLALAGIMAMRRREKK